MPAVSGFQLTENDILRQAYTYRLLQIDHLIALTSRPHKRLHRRILKLIERNYLARIILPNEKHIYAIGPAAVSALVEQGIAPKELIDFRLRHRELKPLFLHHMLMIVEIHTALELATRNSHIKLVAWKEGQELFDSVRDPGSGRRLPVRPDGFFTLEDTTRPTGRNRVHFFLEADRSTTTHARFQEKLIAYWHYFATGGHEKKHGIKTFRVATVTLTEDRAGNLCQLAATVLPQQAKKFYLFSSRRHFSISAPSAILEEIFITPNDHLTRRHSLVPSVSGGMASRDDIKGVDF
jgi:Replication-relaxation